MNFHFDSREKAQITFRNAVSRNRFLARVLQDIVNWRPNLWAEIKFGEWVSFEYDGVEYRVFRATLDDTGKKLQVSTTVEDGVSTNGKELVPIRITKPTRSSTPKLKIENLEGQD